MAVRFQVSLIFVVSGLVLCMHLVSSANILFATFVSVKSHMITFELLLETLAARGHNVTVVSPHRTDRNVTNLTHVLTMDYNQFLDKYNPDYRTLEKKEGYDNPQRPGQLIELACELCYDAKNVQALLSQKFDLVMVPPMINACAAGFVHKLNTSLILLGLVQSTDWVLSPVGGVLNTASDDASFWNRVENIRSKVVFAYYDWTFKAKYADLYRRSLGDDSIPSVDTIWANASLVLSYGHFSADYPRPLFPDVIDIRGLHCVPPKPLPHELEQIVIDSGPHGFILFSFGSGLSVRGLSSSKVELFLNAFSKLKETIIWKWEGDAPANLPPNVKLISWLPQQDLLGHPSIKAFITQGGYLSLTEAIYHGVPVLGLPIVADQFVNLDRAEELGTAVVLNFTTLTSTKLYDGLQELLSNEKYKANAITRSRLLKDQPLTPMDSAIFWIEYVIRHGGAKHLRSSARDLSFVVLNSLDILAILFMVTLLFLYTVFSIIRYLCKLTLVQTQVKVKRS